MKTVISIIALLVSSSFASSSIEPASNDNSLDLEDKNNAKPNAIVIQPAQIVPDYPLPPPKVILSDAIKSQNNFLQIAKILLWESEDFTQKAPEFLTFYTKTFQNPLRIRQDRLQQNLNSAIFEYGLVLLEKILELNDDILLDKFFELPLIFECTNDYDQNIYHVLAKMGKFSVIAKLLNTVSDVDLDPLEVDKFGRNAADAILEATLINMAYNGVFHNSSFSVFVRLAIASNSWIKQQMFPSHDAYISHVEYRLKALKFNGNESVLDNCLLTHHNGKSKSQVCNIFDAFFRAFSSGTISVNPKSHWSIFVKELNPPNSLSQVDSFCPLMFDGKSIVASLLFIGVYYQIDILVDLLDDIGADWNLRAIDDLGGLFMNSEELRKQWILAE